MDDSLHAELDDGTLHVSKAEFLRYMEAQFDAADSNHDGNLDIEEFRLFLNLLSHPDHHPG